MLRRALTILIAFTALFAGGVGGKASGSLRAGSYLIRCRRGALSPLRLSGLCARHGLRPVFQYEHAWYGLAATLSRQQAVDLASDPEVLELIPDGEIQIRPDMPVSESDRRLAAGLSNRQESPTGIRRCGAAVSATASITGRGRDLGVDVAVIDTGILRNHPDLRVVGGFAANGNSWEDQNGHGTHVAGIIGARDNRIGVVGVAPGARLWAVKVLGRSGSGSWSNVIAGLDWVARHSSTIRIANLSLAGVADNAQPIREAVDNCVAKGIIVVAAAGNQANDSSLFIPAAFASVITVSALADSNGAAGESAGPFNVPHLGTELDEGVLSVSNYGPKIDLIAPGANIRSTWKNGKYAYLTGTSMAAPHVAGAAALFRFKHPQATVEEVRQALIGLGDAFAPPNDPDGIQEPALQCGAL